MRAGRSRGGALMPATASGRWRRCRPSSLSSRSGAAGLYGFRWRDRLDCCSAATGSVISPLDQVIGIGDGTISTFQLIKTYGGAFAPYARAIGKPVNGSVRVAVADGEVAAGSAFTCDAATGVVTFLPEHTPPPGAAVTAGFKFDVPVRFDTDYLEVDLATFAAGAIPKIPLVEIRL
ncbi:hypothetical protein NB311A_12529 [Nitrobacter sp. Nb-311A]|nr:hypothetical protein NB311A_12529 [Nitrobacter sp. Nb-311A]